jgi:hypothetical protein
MKTPSRFVQKNHLENIILHDKDTRVQNRRILASALEYANFSLLSKIEPKNCIESSEDKHWIDAME